jgi:DNA invertase Pin-like site-specific DNA recombinase
MRFPKKTSVKEEGLLTHLDRTRDAHNGYGYSDFEKMLEAKVAKTNIAKAFKVSKQTVWRWLDIYTKEKNNG